MHLDNDVESKVFDFMAILWSLWIMRNKIVFHPSNLIRPAIMYDWIKVWKERWMKIQNQSSNEVGKQNATKEKLINSKQTYWKKNGQKRPMEIS